MKRILISLLVLSAFAVPTVWAQTAGFKLAAPVGMPGDNPEYGVNPVLIYNFAPKRLLSFQGEIAANAQTHLNDPIGAVFNNQGELFIANRHGNVPGAGSIARFVPDRTGNYVPNGVIIGNGLEGVHGLAFSPTGELFASSLYFGRISRFVFDPQGNAIPNGSFYFDSSVLGLAFNNKGELFVATGWQVVLRFLLDPSTGQLTFNGVIEIADGAATQFLAFSPTGELFVSDISTDRVYRFQFNCAGQAFASGAIEVPGGPVGVAFSPTGQLFVSLHYSGGIRRFDFDSKGNAILVESIETPNMGQIAVSPR